MTAVAAVGVDAALEIVVIVVIAPPTVLVTHPAVAQEMTVQQTGALT